MKTGYSERHRKQREKLIGRTLRSVGGGAGRFLSRFRVEIQVKYGIPECKPGLNRLSFHTNLGSNTWEGKSA